MARSNTETLMPLDQWAEIMGIDHFNFNQIGNGIVYHGDPQCKDVVFQHAWQLHYFSVDEIAGAVRKAEEALARLLNYYPAPRYVTDETVWYKQDANTYVPNWMTPRGQWKRVRTVFQHVQALGTIKRTLITANAATTTRSDADNDDVEDTFTLTVTTTETNVQKIAVYYSAVHRETLDETWRILPLRITANGTTASIVGRLSLIINPVLKETPKPERLDATDEEIYVPTLDVYLVETDATGIGTAFWDETVDFETPTSSALDSTSPIVYPLLGHFRPIIPGCYTVGRAPDRLQINYLAGVARDNTGRLREPYASMVAYLSCQYLPSDKCGCERAEQIIRWYRSFPSDGEEGKRPMTAREIDENILGTSRGAIYAWQQAQLLENPA